MIKQVNLYKKYSKITDSWLCFGGSSMVTIKDYKSFSEVEEINKLILDKNEEKYCLYLLSEETERDDEFWEDAESKNFVFLSFLRLNKIDEQKEKVKELLKQKIGNCMIYSSLDTYDLVIAHYKDSITGLMEPFEILKNYQIEILETNSMILSHIKNPVEGEALPLVSFRFRLKHLKKFKKIDTFLKEKDFEKTLRNGNYDYEYFKKNMTISELFCFFSEEKVMDHSYEELYKAVAEMEIRLYDDQELPIELLKVEQSDEEFELFKLYNNLKYRYSKYITRDLTYLMDFMIESFQKRYYNDLFLVVYKPLKMFLRKYIEALQNLIDDNNNFDDIKESYDIFMTSINELFLIFNYSRVHVIRGFAYQGHKITMPFKMINYYTEIMEKLIEILIENENEYEFCFLLLPSTKSNIHIQTLINDEKYKNRLLLVTLPVDQIFNIRMMNFQLAHEIGHYICDKVREREERKDDMWEAISETLYLMIFNADNSDTKEFAEYLFANLIKEIRYFKKKTEAFNPGVENSFRDAIIKIVPRLLKGVLFNFVRNLEFNKNEYLKNKTTIKTNKDFKELDIKLKNYTSTFEKKVLDVFLDNDIENQFLFLLKNCDEGFSDIIAIKVFNLSLIDFINFFNDEWFDIIGFNNPDFIITRIAIVICAVGFDTKQICDSDIENTYKKQVIRKAIALSDYLNEILNKVDNYLSQEEINEAFKQVQADIYVPKKLGTYKSLYYLYLYLKKCNDSLDSLKFNESNKLQYDYINNEKNLMEIINELQKNIILGIQKE